MSNQTKSFWTGSLTSLKNTSTTQIVGELLIRVSSVHKGDEAKQIEAWREQIDLLKKATSSLKNTESIGVLLEMPLTRLGKRIDTILTCPQGIICIEFKIGGDRYLNSDVNQTEDYALCLRSFHSASHKHPIFPILCTTNSLEEDLKFEQVDGINKVWKTNSSTLEKALRKIQTCSHFSPEINWSSYDLSTYNPTPSIIEAARLIYAGHNVKDIGRTDATQQDLAKAAKTLSKVIANAKANQNHTVCFVTGEPGAGKTLLGLNLVFGSKDLSIGDTPAALLSGNRPLVAVLREAVANDAVKRKTIKISKARRETSQALQHLLGYLKEHLSDTSPPPENVIVFDEAQRAWDAKTGEKLLDRHASEPEIFLEIMGKLPWACLICLVGPGQEINTGEVGMSLWREAISKTNKKWDAVISVENKIEDEVIYEQNFEPSLYLKSQLRAYKNAYHGQWVKELLNGNISEAKKITLNMNEVPAYISRDLVEVKKYLRERSRGKHRVGLLASSGAKRLIADGIPPSPMSKELKDVTNWFLNPSDDFRSSNALEKPLSEYVCQGLEIDYAALCWGCDLIWENKNWQPRQMFSPKWRIIRNEQNKIFKLNAYRVLLTRSRSGLIIYIPKGSDIDSTRSSKSMDLVYSKLIAAGCSDLK